MNPLLICQTAAIICSLNSWYWRGCPKSNECSAHWALRQVVPEPVEGLRNHSSKGSMSATLITFGAASWQLWFFSQIMQLLLEHFSNSLECNCYSRNKSATAKTSCKQSPATFADVPPTTNCVLDTIVKVKATKVTTSIITIWPQSIQPQNMSIKLSHKNKIY